MRLFLCGDVMTGRGVDQILPNPGDPAIHEQFCRSALDYVALAERQSGPIPRSVGFDYVWGDLLAVLEKRAPDLRIVNLETSITPDGSPEPKGINYRMHPGNADVLAAARIDCCVLANNHVADWGMAGLVDTLGAVSGAGIASAGAGTNADAAAAPAVLEVAGRRVLVLAYGSPTAGVPLHWQAGAGRPGVSVLPDLSDASLRRVAADVGRSARPGDLVLASVHWGPNWGYTIDPDRRRFARALVETAGVHVVHGHSSHHPLAIEVSGGQPVLYGCGDLINDYEGIGGYERYRGELSLAYFLDLSDEDHRLESLELVPFRIRRFRLNRVSAADLAWMEDCMGRECGAFGLAVRRTEMGTLRVDPC